MAKIPIHVASRGIKNTNSNMASQIVIHIGTVLKAGVGFRMFLLAVP